MYDIVAVGESLIDFVSNNNEFTGKLQYEGNPGGAPANVLAAAAKFGLKTAFIGKVGNDSFGSFLKTSLDNCRIDTSSLIMGDDCNTTLAFVSLDKTENRNFSFYRKNTADVNLTSGEINFDAVKNTKIFHFGSVSLTDEPSRSATFSAVRLAKENNITISYDPNFRKPLWRNSEEAKEIILSGLELADIVKLSDDELLFLTGTKNFENAMNNLYNRYNLKFLAVTMGPRGCICKTSKAIKSAFAFDVPCVDTTGAGDAFMGSLLYQIISSIKDIDYIGDNDLKQIMDFSNAAGSLAATKKGAIPAMPLKKEILDCIKNVSYLEF